MAQEPLSPRLQDEIAKLVEKAKDKEVHLTIKNFAGRPFEVITIPSESLAWGVGGSSGGTK